MPWLTYQVGDLPGAEFTAPERAGEAQRQHAVPLADHGVGRSANMLVSTTRRSRQRAGRSVSCRDE